MTSLVSVIVPVYNTKNAVRRCVESLLRQSYSNIEIVLVDDGSTDGSAEECAKLCSMDARIRFYGQANGGVSHARNRGISESFGEYHCFVDSDDIVAPNYVSTLVDMVSEFGADIGACRFERIMTYDHVFSRCSAPVEIVSSPDAVERLLRGGTTTLGSNAWCKIYRTSKLGEIRFVEGRAINEDRFYVYSALMASDRIVLRDCCIYGYYSRAGSSSKLMMERGLRDPEYFAEEISEDLKNHSRLRSGASYNLYRTRASVYRDIQRAAKCERQAHDEYAEHLRRSLLSAKRVNLSTGERVERLFLRFPRPIYRVALFSFDLVSGRRAARSKTGRD